MVHLLIDTTSVQEPLTLMLNTIRTLLGSAVDLSKYKVDHNLLASRPVAAVLLKVVPFEGKVLILFQEEGTLDVSFRKSAL